MGGLITGLLGGGLFSAVPAILAVAALIDCARVGAGWYWYWIILWFPVVGPLAYFVVVRSPVFAGTSTALVSPHVARRQQARRRLRQLQVQLAHWRGPGVLAEAGEELLVLGKLREAEAHFREARQNGAGVEDVNFGLAQALEMQGRWDEAAPLLTELVAVEPDSHLGEGPLHLARSLDESGRRDEAEAALRKVLEKRTVIEAQIRLARLLYAKGEKAEADRIVAEVRNDAKLLPRYLKRRHWRWIWAARGLSATTRLPKPRVEGALAPAGVRLLTVVVALALAALAAGALYYWTEGRSRPAPGATREHRAVEPRQPDRSGRIGP
ncbi:MAG: tetratricopeptide repeat protein [Thermoanaerobaculia bacterium]